MASNQNSMDVSVRIYDETAGVDFTFTSVEQAMVKIEDNVYATFSLCSLTYEKKISSPCHATADVHVNKNGSLTLSQLVTFFKGKKVDLSNKNTDKVIAANYFVFRATPSQDKNGNVSVVLDIYSLDKLLDTVKYSRAYTARRLRADILTDAVARCQTSGLAVPVSDSDKLTLLVDSSNNEFAQPYIVQYNETAYNMLSRTANRCGEFFYFENGVLHLGLPADLSNDNGLELGSDDSKLDYLSISCSDSVASTFGNDQDFLIDDYHKASKQSFDNQVQALAAGAQNFTIAVNGLLSLMLESHSKYTSLKDDINVFRQNADYYECYYKAKTARAAYLHYDEEIAKIQAEMGTYEYKGGVFSNSRIEKEFEPYLKDSIDSKEKELQAAIDKQAKNDYFNKKQYIDYLKKEADEAYQAWQKAMDEGAADVEQKEMVYQDANSAYVNEKEKYKPSIEALIEQENAEIAKLRRELSTLNNVLKEWQSGSLSPGSKQNLLNDYKSQIVERLSTQYEALDTKKTEYNTAKENQTKEPSIYTKYKDKASPWDKFKEWGDVIEATEDGYKDRIDDIWKNVLDKGKKQFPIDVESCIKTLKESAEAVQSDINDKNKISSVLKDSGKKDEADGYCKSIISYCDAFIAMLDNNTSKQEADSKALPGVYDFEYVNDEYLQCVKKDGKGVYNDFYCNSLTRDQDNSDYAAWVIIGLVSRFLTDRRTKTAFLAAEAIRDSKAAILAGIMEADFHSDYNKNHINGYKLNGVSAKDCNFVKGDEVSMFTTYTRTVGNSGASDKGMSEAFAGTFYKAVYVAERSLEEQKITIRVDCASNKKEAHLGSKIKYDDKSYVVVGVHGSLIIVDGISRLEQVVEAVPAFADTIIIPTAIEADRFCKSAPQIATVAADNDPTYEGRVRVRFHWQGSDEESSPWLRVGTPYATKGGGMLFIPHVGDQVMLDFERGNVERPFVTTSLYNEGDNITPPTTVSKATRRQTISSANGHGITFTDKKNGTFITEAFCSLSSMATLGSLFNLGADKSAGGGVEISDSYGFYSINCSADKRNISISSPLGDINLNAFTGISIKAPNGDLKIEAKNIEISAGNELRMTSGTFLKDEMDSKDFLKDLGSAAAKEAIAATIGTIDLSLIRHVLERFLRPVSASTMIKSYRLMVLDAGNKDMNFGGLVDDKSKTVRVKSYNGWTNKVAPDEYGKQVGGQVLSQLANIGKSIVPEYNLWKVQSTKNAIIVAGDMYSTDVEKKQIKDFSAKRANAPQENADITIADALQAGEQAPRYDTVDTTLGGLILDNFLIPLGKASAHGMKGMLDGVAGIFNFVVSKFTKKEEASFGDPQKSEKEESGSEKDEIKSSDDSEDNLSNVSYVLKMD